MDTCFVTNAILLLLYIDCVYGGGDNIDITAEQFDKSNYDHSYIIRVSPIWIHVFVVIIALLFIINITVIYMKYCKPNQMTRHRKILQFSSDESSEYTTTDQESSYSSDDGI